MNYCIDDDADHDGNDDDDDDDDDDHCWLLCTRIMYRVR